MARKVKCYVTGEEGTSDTFIKIGTHYYKSQAVYDKHRHEIEVRKHIVALIANEFLEYRQGQRFPAYIQQKLKEFEYYSPDVILATIEKTYDKIMYQMRNKSFKSESGKISYIFAIISNNINDVNKEYKWKQKEEKVNEPEHIEVPEISSDSPPVKAKDISEWLDDI